MEIEHIKRVALLVTEIMKDGQYDVLLAEISLIRKERFGKNDSMQKLEDLLVSKMINVEGLSENQIKFLNAYELTEKTMHSFIWEHPMSLCLSGVDKINEEFKDFFKNMLKEFNSWNVNYLSLLWTGQIGLMMEK